MKIQIGAFFLTAVFAGGMVCGQVAQPRAAGEVPVRVKELTNISKCDLETPNFAKASSGRKQKWGVLDATFDVFPEWIDSLSVTYTVMCEKSDPKLGEKKFSLLSLTSTYEDVLREKDRKVGVVIPPNKLKRLGMPIGFVVQFYVNDKLVGGMSAEEGPLRGRRRWWEDPAVVDTSVNKNLEKVDGVLLDRSKTVFGFVEMDNYEVSK